MALLIAYVVIAVIIAFFSGMAFAFEFFGDERFRDKKVLTTSARWFVRSPVWPIILVPTLARMFKAMLTYGAPR